MEVLEGQLKLKESDLLVDLDDSKYREEQPVLKSSSFSLNTFLGGPPNKHGVVPYPGIALGKIVQLYGAESSGKTTLALDFAAQVCAAGGSVGYIDWEHEIMPLYAQKIGVPVFDKNRFRLYQPSTLEIGFKAAYVMAGMGVDLIVFDSVGAAVPQSVYDKPLNEISESGAIGLNARFWSQNLPKLKTEIVRTGTVVIGISQMRDAIGSFGYGPKSNVQGGRAWKYWSALRLLMQKKNTEKGRQYSMISNKTEEAVIGAYTKIRADKCKQSAIQGNETSIYIRYGEGIDNVQSIIDIAKAYKIVKTASAWVSWIAPDGEEHKSQGGEKFRALLVNNPKLLDILEKQVKEKMYSRMISQAAEAEDEEDDDDVMEDGMMDLDLSAINFDEE